VIGGPGKAIVYGHGVFAIGRDGFEEAFRSMVDVENRCREEYFRRFDERRPGSVPDSAEGAARGHFNAQQGSEW
jgi:hypothetical protein